MKLLAIVGSPRLKGNTNYLVEQALGEARNNPPLVEDVRKLGRQMVESLKERT